MNVLLTGGTGYIGSHTAVVLSELGHEVVLFDNLSNSSEDVLLRLGQISGYRIPFVHGDVRDTELLKHALAIHKIEAVVHFAGLKAVGESVQNPVDYYDNNVMGTISLIQAMKAQRVMKLVFSSSATVYGNPHYLPLNEEHPTIAINPYGRTKLHIEEMLNDIAKSEHQWSIVCLRYFNPVGAHESGLIGETPNGIPNNLMPFIAQVAEGRRAELSIFGGDYETVDGTGVRDYIHVTDLAEGHAAALNSIQKKNIGWIAINLGTGKGYSVLEMINAFESVSGKKIPYKVVGRRVGDVAVCFSDSKKALEVLNWSAKRTLDDMCSSTWQFQRSFGLKALL